MTLSVRIGNTGLDLDVLETVDKILSTIFMILLVVYNIAFAVATIVRHRKAAFTQARYNVRLSLALGGFVSGLIMIQHVVDSFGDYRNSPHCSLYRLSIFYYSEFIPVLYACGFSLLVVDIIARSKNVQAFANLLNRNNKLAFVLVPLPWIVSVVVVCPLTLTAIDWSDCDSSQTKHHIKTRLVLLKFFPTAIVIFGAVICSYIVTRQLKSSTQRFKPAATPASQPEESNNPNIVEMGIRSEPSPQDLNTQSVAFETKPLTSDMVNIVPAVAPHEQDTLYSKDVIRKENLIVALCSVVFVLAVVPYFIVCLYIVNNFRSQNHDSLVYPDVGDSTWLAFYISSFVMELLPILMPMISMTM